MVSSNQIKAATGVGAKTLTRWAQAGVIPPPRVGQHPSGRGKLGYWECWVLDRCEAIVTLQKQGHSLQEAVRRLGGLVNGEATRVEGDPLKTISKAWALILGELGYDLKDPHFKDSPDRVAKFLLEWHTSSADQNPPPLTNFPNGKAAEHDAPAERGYDQVLLVKDIGYYSMCAHHGLPFFGVAHVGYIPDKKLVGLSKLARVVDYFARRFQTQELITMQVADYLEKELAPIGVGVILQGEHLCMAMRGIKKPGHSTISSEMRGVFRVKPEARAELLAFVRG